MYLSSNGEQIPQEGVDKMRWLLTLQKSSWHLLKNSTSETNIITMCQGPGKPLLGWCLPLQWWWTWLAHLNILALAGKKYISLAISEAFAESDVHSQGTAYVSVHESCLHNRNLDACWWSHGHSDEGWATKGHQKHQNHPLKPRYTRQQKACSSHILFVLLL